MVQRTSDQGLGTGAEDLTRRGPVARRIWGSDLEKYCFSLGNMLTWGSDLEK